MDYRARSLKGKRRVVWSGAQPFPPHSVWVDRRRSSKFWDANEKQPTFECRFEKVNQLENIFRDKLFGPGWETRMRGYMAAASSYLSRCLLPLCSLWWIALLEQRRRKGLKGVGDWKDFRFIQQMEE
ncbi:hypothetical protein Ocin01_07685 [Orchesella cincta]|uniref:Uncharacterized protein n=1 Tax=Orchesella cincta TaxID=48709 RepID=A0A1D2N1R8_ORCCI|nr:hypothetical protein Ocin01_07685 [Orchesella cincta]